MDEGNNEAETVCYMCGRTDNEDLLLLCDGIIRRETSRDVIRCNTACHTYCLPVPTNCVPDGRWYCSYCQGSIARRTGYDLRPRRSRTLEQEMIENTNGDRDVSRRRTIPAVDSTVNLLRDRSLSASGINAISTSDAG